MITKIKVISIKVALFLLAIPLAAFCSVPAFMFPELMRSEYDDGGHFANYLLGGGFFIITFITFSTIFIGEYVEKREKAKIKKKLKILGLV